MYSKSADPCGTAKTTIVTAFFSINTKRKNNTLYVEWMKTFFERVESPIIAYTSPEWVPIIGTFNKNTEVKIIPIEFDDLFFERRYNEVFWKKQINLNSEREFVDKKVAIIWLEKMYFVARAMEENYFNTEIFVWMDVGIFRTNDWFNPDLFGDTRSFTLTSSQLVVAQIYDQFNANYLGLSEPPALGFSGNVQIGSEGRWMDYISHFERTVDKYIVYNTTLANDQLVIFSLYREAPEKYVNRLNLLEREANTPDIWFLFSWYLQNNYIKLRMDNLKGEQVCLKRE